MLLSPPLSVQGFLSLRFTTSPQNFPILSAKRDHPHRMWPTKKLCKHPKLQQQQGNTLLRLDIANNQTFSRIMLKRAAIGCVCGVIMCWLLRLALLCSAVLCAWWCHDKLAGPPLWTILPLVPNNYPTCPPS